jgi:hypothetical protein
LLDAFYFLLRFYQILLVQPYLLPILLVTVF